MFFSFADTPQKVDDSHLVILLALFSGILPFQLFESVIRLFRRRVAVISFAHTC